MKNDETRERVGEGKDRKRAVGGGMQIANNASASAEGKPFLAALRSCRGAVAPEVAAAMSGRLRTHTTGS